MPGGRTKFQESWLSKELDGVPVKEWCSRTDNNFFAHCTLCCDRFDISNSGFSQVKSHHNGKKHRARFEGRFSSKPISEAFAGTSRWCSRGVDELPLDLRVAKAEALWVLKVVSSHISFRSCNEIVELFKEMFPDSQIAAQMELKEKKAAYIISHGLGKHFEEDLKQDIARSSSVTVAFDETTNAQVKHQLDIYVRYWSEEINSVSCRYLTSIFMGHATADLLLKELLDAFSTFNIGLQKIMCLSMDGPNVNKSLLRKFNEAMKRETGKETLDLGFCNLHVVNNAFKQLLSSLLFDFDEFSTDIHYYLKSAARRADFKAAEDITSVTARFLMHHVSSRWLTVGPVAERILEQWPNLTEYFLKFLPQQKALEKHLSTSDRYKRIHSTLKNGASSCYLAFISFCHKNFESFSLCFQSESPKVHLLYSQMNDLVRKIMGQFIHDNLVMGKSGQDLQDMNIESSNSWKPLKDLEIGTKTKNLVMANLEEKERKRFLLDVRAALITTIKYLKKNLPFCNQKLKDLQVLNPKIQCEMSHETGVTANLNEITRICSYVDFSEELTDKVREEWKLFQCDKSAQLDRSVNGDPVCERVDYYWRNIFAQKDQFGKEKFSNLAKLIKAVVILPHGNADPERGFSVNNAMLSKDKTRFNDLTVRSLRVVKDAVKHYGGACKVPITKTLLHNVRNAHKTYKEYLEKKREEEEKLRKEKEEKEKEKESKEIEKKRKVQLDVKISENEDQIHRIKKDRQTALAVIQEGNERMKKAVASLNTTQINIAQKLIIQGTEELSKLDAELTALEAQRDMHVKKRLKF